MQYFITIFQEHKLLFSTIGVVLLVCLFLLFSALQNVPQDTSPSTPVFIKTPDITPAVSKENVTILKVSPTNNASNAQIYEPIIITFSRPLKSNETASILVTAVPDIQGQRVWSNTSDTLTITPKQPLQPNQQYILKVKYFDQEFLWSFITVPLDQVSEENQIRAQSQADQNYAKAMKKIETAYPWLEKLPLQSDFYFVYFDVDKKQIIAFLYPKTANQIPLKDQEENFKNEITNKLQSLGVDTVKTPPKWISKPEP